MCPDYNHQAAIDFIQALREGDRKAAFASGQAITQDPDAVNYGVPLDQVYNDMELAQLIEENLKGIDQGRWDMTSKIYLPIVIGAICQWVIEELHRDTDGKTDSQSFEQRKEQDPTGS